QNAPERAALIKLAELRSTTMIVGNCPEASVMLTLSGYELFGTNRSSTSVFVYSSSFCTTGLLSSGSSVPNAGSMNDSLKGSSAFAGAVCSMSAPEAPLSSPSFCADVPAPAFPPPPLPPPHAPSSDTARRAAQSGSDHLHIFLFTKH